MYNFNALISRIKYIPRWNLMRQSRQEYLAEHTTEVMQIAHTLALIAKNKFGKNINCEHVVVCALYHDVSEILTGDMPTPVKYHNDNLKSAYKHVEKNAMEKLSEAIDPDIREDIFPYMTAEHLSSDEKSILKAADRLSALIKCIEEIQIGNHEFNSAHKSVYSSLVDMKLAEVDFFIENMLPSYNLCLDELAKI